MYFLPQKMKKKTTKCIFCQKIYKYINNSKYVKKNEI